MCEHYVSHGHCADFPDWSIAAAGSESLVKIGYEYGRSVTGDELAVDLDRYENHDQSSADPQEEASLVATSEVCIHSLFKLVLYCVM